MHLMISVFAALLSEALSASEQNVRILKQSSSWRSPAVISVEIATPERSHAISLPATVEISGESSEPDLVFTSWGEAKAKIIQGECENPVSGPLKGLAGTPVPTNGFWVNFADQDGEITTAPKTSYIYVTYWLSGHGKRDAFIDCPDFDSTPHKNPDWVDEYYRNSEYKALPGSDTLTVHYMEPYYAEMAQITFKMTVLGKSFTQKFNSFLESDVMGLRTRLPMDLHRTFSVADIRKNLCHKDVAFPQKLALAASFPRHWVDHAKNGFEPNGELLISHVSDLPLNAVRITVDDDTSESDPSLITISCKAD